MPLPNLRRTINDLLTGAAVRAEAVGLLQPKYRLGERRWLVGNIIETDRYNARTGEQIESVYVRVAPHSLETNYDYALKNAGALR